MAQERVSKFLEAITNDALRIKNEILKSANELNKSEIEKAEIEATHEAETMINAEISAARNQLRKEMYEREKEKKQKLFSRRSAITLETFRKTSEKLKRFALTDEYAEKMSVELKNLMKTVETKDLVITLSDKDVNLKNTFMKFGDISLTVDEKILIGGFKALDCSNNRLYDCTLDTKLKDQYEWFLENSDLSL